MTRRLGTVAADANLHEAIATMNQGGFRRLGVSDGEGRIVGVLSVGLWDPHSLESLLGDFKGANHEKLA